MNRARIFALTKRWWGRAVGAATIVGSVVAWATAGFWWPASVKDVAAAESRMLQVVGKQYAGVEQFNVGTREISLRAQIGVERIELASMRRRHDRTPGDHDLKIRITEKEELLKRLRKQLAEIVKYQRR